MHDFFHSKRKLALVTAVFAVLSVCLVLRLSSKTAHAGRPEQDLRIAAVAVATRGSIVNSLTLSGAFHPYQQVDIHAKVAGYIRTIYVDVGDHVKEGQTLAVLEVPELNAQVAGAKADLRRDRDAIRRAQSEIERAQSTHAAYHTAYTRLKQASEARSGLIAEQELDDSMAKDKDTEGQIESAQAAYAEAQNQLAVAQADLDRLSALESYSRITAPFAGVITKRYADTGSLIQAGTTSDTQSMPVVQLAEWNRLRLVVPVPESAVSDLHLGSAVQVHVAALNRDFVGHVARYADALNDETRTMHTEIDVENLDGTLKDGMYAEAKLVLTQQNNALTIPIQALQRNREGGTVLLLDSNNRVQERQVTLGAESNDCVEIVTGLHERDQVIIGSRGEFHIGEQVRPKAIAQPSTEGAS